MNVQAVPLIYYLQTDGVTQLTILQANLTYNNFGCDPGPIRTMPMTLAGGIWSGAFTNIPAGTAGAGAVGNVGTYEMNAVTCPAFLAAGGEPIAINAVGNDNTNFVGAVFGFNTTANFNSSANFATRLDNFGVSNLAAITTPNGRTNNWMNDVVKLNGLNTAFPAAAGSPLAALRSPDGIVTGGNDLGVSRIIGFTTLAASTNNPAIFTARVGLAAASAGTVDATTAVASLVQTGLQIGRAHV